MKMASRQSPNASVRTAKTTRITLKTVKTLARMMLAHERLVAGGSSGMSASRRVASASVRPSAGPPRKTVGASAVGSVATSPS